MLELDRISQLAEQLQLNLRDEQGKFVAEQISRLAMRALSEEVSGVSVSPEYNFHTIVDKSESTGLILSLEKRTAAVDPLALPILMDNWGLEHIKNNYALAKLELYYHPRELLAKKKKQFVAELYDYCQYLGIDFLLQLRLFKVEQNDSPESQQEALLQTLEELRLSADVIALAFPADPLTAVTVTAELDIPWLYSAEGVDYGLYKEQLRASLESGAKGFLAGDVLWAELPEPSANEEGVIDFANTQDYLETIARDRVIELVRITNEYDQEDNQSERSENEASA